MAYFANGSEGMVFEEQCAQCKFGEEPCPIALVQMNFNYPATKNETATHILESLVKNDGTCEMFRTFKKDFEIGFDDDKVIAENYKKLLKNNKGGK